MLQTNLAIFMGQNHLGKCPPFDPFYMEDNLAPVLRQRTLLAPPWYSLTIEHSELNTVFQLEMVMSKVMLVYQRVFITIKHHETPLNTI